MTNLGERPSFILAMGKSSFSGAVPTAAEFLREAESEAPQVSPPSDILFFFVEWVWRSDFFVFGLSSLFLFFTAPFWDSRSEGLRFGAEAETLSFFCNVPWSFFQLLERFFKSIPMIYWVSEHSDCVISEGWLGAGARR